MLETIFVALGLVKEAQDAFGSNEVLPKPHWPNAHPQRTSAPLETFRRMPFG